MTTYGLSLRATAVFEKITIQTVSLRVSDDRLTVFDGRDSGQDVGWICSGLIDHEKRGRHFSSGFCSIHIYLLLVMCACITIEWIATAEYQIANADLLHWLECLDSRVSESRPKEHTVATVVGIQSPGLSGLAWDLVSGLWRMCIVQTPYPQIIHQLLQHKLNQTDRKNRRRSPQKT